MLKVGIAGLGFMGKTHFEAYGKIRGAKVVAICEKDPKRLAGDWRSIKGNFGPPGEIVDLTGVKGFSEFDQLLGDAEIDMVDICLPPGAHASVAICALKAGKHVFCEKPIALRPADAEEMIAAAKAAGKMLVIGHVLPFFPEYRFAYRTITSGKYGALTGGRFKRIISDPTWLPDFYNPNTTGGPMIDLHIHDAHFIRLVCGMPRAVQSVGRMRGEVVERFDTQFIFDDSSLVVTAASGVIYQQGRPFMHGYEIYLERATLLFESCTINDQQETVMPVTVLTEDGKLIRPKMEPIDAFAAELSEAVRAMRTGTPSTVLNAELAHDALVLCQRQTQSVLKGKAVKV